MGKFETRWIVLALKLIVPILANIPKELATMQYKYTWVVQEKPAMLVLQCKNIVFAGTVTRQIGKIEKKWQRMAKMPLRQKQGQIENGERREDLVVCSKVCSYQTL